MMYPLPSEATNDYLRQVRQDLRFTVIEDAPQKSILSPVPRTKLTILPINRTPVHPSNASRKGAYNTPASDQTSDASSMWSHRSSQSSYDDHNSLYDVTDDESQSVPIKLSDSVKRHARVAKERARYPSLVIPSPSAWPTIQKLHDAHSPVTVGLSPAIQVAITPAALATFNARARQISATTAPSLDGSLTSEEASLHSCPSTPDFDESSSPHESWDQPMQLDALAFQVLHQLHPSPDDGRDDPPDPVVTITDEELHEMQQIVKDTSLQPDFTLCIQRTKGSDDEEAVSALTVPSPGGFFSSLAPCAAQTWSRRTPEPSTGVAEKFYGVPWRVRTPPDIPAVPNLSLSIPYCQGYNQDLVLSPSQRSEASVITEQYNRAYAQTLHSLGLENSERTRIWLHAQATYLSRIFQDSPTRANLVETHPVTPDRVSSPTLDTISPSKKSVRFVDGLDAILAQAETDISLDRSKIADNLLFYQAFKHLSKVTRRHDAFFARQTRVEAVHLQRAHFVTAHCRQMLGQHHISTQIRPSSNRPVSNLLPAISSTNGDDAFKAAVAAAERERQALDQVKHLAWALQAERYLQGGKLFSSPIDENIRSLPHARILDYGGQVTADWGWQAALDFRNTTVYTLPIITSQVDETSTPMDDFPKGPANHRVVPPSRPWALPFPANYFDVVSARTLHVLLRTTAPSSLCPRTLNANANRTNLNDLEVASKPYTDNDNDNDLDDHLSEYDLALSEIHRVLKPGGYLSYTLYDATLHVPSPVPSPVLPSSPSLSLALSVEFAFELRTRGYDPLPTRTFVPRLRKAGFVNIRRAWLMLPVGRVREVWTDRGKVNTVGATINATVGADRLPTTTGQSTKGKITYGSSGREINFSSVKDDREPSRQSHRPLPPPPLTGSTAAIQDLTHLVGSHAWEYWQLHFGAELGRPAEETVARIARVLEEAESLGRRSISSGGSCGWKCLKGYARKA